MVVGYTVFCEERYREGCLYRIFPIFIACHSRLTFGFTLCHYLLVTTRLLLPYA